MKKIFFFDIDNTLLPSKENAQIPVSTKKAIKKLQEKGHDVYIATGKNKGMVEEIARELAIDNFISSNGQVITMNGEIVYHTPISKDKINELLEKIANEKEKYIIGGQAYEDYFVLKTDKDMYDKYVYIPFKDLSIPLPKEKENLDENMYQLWILGEVDAIDAEKYTKDFQLFRWHKYGYDVLTLNTSKASAIEKLLELFYQNEEYETYAFGDGNNDIAMLKFVDNGIAMGNANDNVKKIADEVTADIEADGIYNYLFNKKIID